MAAIAPAETAASALPSYPPQAGPSSTTRRPRPPPPSTDATSSYLVSAETESVADLRLQITHEPRRDDKNPPRPLFFRERTLTAQDEIVDRLIDASSGHAVWTIHRPTRGWYLHIRSPNLPPSCTIPIRPARPEFVTSTMGVQDPTSTPLTFALGTRVDEGALSRCTEWITDGGGGTNEAASTQAPRQTPTPSQEFTPVELSTKDDVRGGGATNADAGTSAAPSSTSTQGHTAHTSSISSSALQSQRHTRRRSAATTTTPAASPDMRRMNLSGSFASADVQEDGPGEQDEGEGEGGGRGAPTTSSSSPPRSHLHPGPRHLPPSSRASPGDDPYSRARPPRDSTRPTQCYFLLLDGAARKAPRAASSSLTSAPGRIPASASERSSNARLGWAKWVWSLVPEPIRPGLSFDTTKSFSIRWIDIDADADAPSSVEVMRYEDTAGYWLWQSKTRGRFVFQEEALRALRIDRAFWFVVGLAYLEFLEERDGYNAASDG